MKPRKTFEEIVHDISGSTIFLDVDGTLLPDGAQTMSDETVEAVRLLASSNTVYLVSNGKDTSRVTRFADALCVKVPDTLPSRKPSTYGFKEYVTARDPLVVIGDKYCTDGLFARNLKARFVLVLRKRSGRERLIVRISYLIDRVVSWV